MKQNHYTYGLVKNNFIFGSELKVFKNIANTSNESKILNLFLRFAYVPGPKSIYKNIFKLPNGCLFCLKRLDLKNLV